VDAMLNMMPMWCLRLCWSYVEFELCGVHVCVVHVDFSLMFVEFELCVDFSLMILFIYVMEHYYYVNYFCQNYYSVLYL